MMFKVTLEKKNFESSIRWLLRYEDAINKPSVIAVGVPFIGAGMLGNFQSEGAAAAGGWAQLTPTTQRIRRERGYDPQHPIMVQSGNLRRMTAEMLKQWKVTQTSAVAYDGKGTGLGAAVSRRGFRATVRGPKVENQYGGNVALPGGKTGRLPRRRFFGITQDASDKAAKAMFDRVMFEWRKMSTYAKEY